MHCQTGSSPLARGLQCAWRSIVRRGRIIPARAGFTHLCSVPLLGLWDHPRSRGVYSSRGNKWGSVGGSSPLARGLRSGPFGWGSVFRIIPARAGFTKLMVVVFIFGPDHPRSRGVYIYLYLSSIYSIGSSPLARGLLQYPHPVTSRTDHPRSRGVYAFARLRATSH